MIGYGIAAAGRLELAFVLLTLSTGAVNLLFSTFHVELFRTAYGLDAVHFATGHAIYACWNTANDLFSGVVADSLAARRAGGSRVPLVRVAGLLWVTVGFLFPWWRWGALMPLSVQFVMALSLFDGFYSFVAIVEGALLAEVAPDTCSRARIGRLTSLSAMVVFPLVSRLGFASWDANDLRAFRQLALCVSCLATVGIVFGAALLQRLPQSGVGAHVQGARQIGNQSKTVRESYGQLSTKPQDDETSALKLACRDVLGPGLGHKNFVRFCCMDALLEAENVFWNNFKLTFANALLPGIGWSQGQISDLLSVIPTVARLVRIALYSVVDRIGVAPVYRASFLIKMALSVLAIVVAVSSPGDSYLESVFLPVMFIVGNVVVAAPLGMFALTISELVDEHRHEEAKSSATVPGLIGDGKLVAGRYQSTHALLAKPCNSLGPIIVSLVLPESGISTGRSSQATQHGRHMFNSTIDRGEDQLEETAQAQMCFALISVLPFIAGCVQFYIWRSYTLSKDRAERIQHALRKQAQRVEGEDCNESHDAQQLHNP